MKRYALLIVSLVFVCLLVGCSSGDAKISQVIEGQPAPHAGYNIGPDIWVEPNEPVKLTGVVIWIKGTDPNNLFGE